MKAPLMDEVRVRVETRSAALAKKIARGIVTALKCPSFKKPLKALLTDSLKQNVTLKALFEVEDVLLTYPDRLSQAIVKALNLEDTDDVQALLDPLSQIAQQEIRDAIRQGVKLAHIKALLPSFNFQDEGQGPPEPEGEIEPITFR